ncbi:hypothetical protein J1N35_029268 [Gossypium stocksii]|uniref:Uncharacterized protein n=1 Tax=Gossypium stocksii TaxID=47602 RepID=A0A9D3ZRW7_9ROSI|nr:hypothetical protein J1N35_029268 [Gossypium stocksii]
MGIRFRVEENQNPNIVVVEGERGDGSLALKFLYCGLASSVPPGSSSVKWGKSCDQNHITLRNKENEEVMVSTVELVDDISKKIDSFVGLIKDNINDSMELQEEQGKDLINQEYVCEFDMDVIVLLETRISRLRMESIIMTLGFDYSHRVESRGFAGGICIMWKDTMSINIQLCHFQYIHLSVNRAQQDRVFHWTVVYGSPDAKKRELLWDSLNQMARLMKKSLLLAGEEKIKGLRPFRFLVGGLTHSSFPELVKENWIFNGTMKETIDNFTNEAKKWNSNTFSNLTRRKKETIARIKGVQWALERKQTRNMRKLEFRLKQEVEMILDLEEPLWKQKSRCNWITEGDRNTKYFHSRTMKRRRTNRIEALNLTNGEWSFEEEVLNVEAASFFKNLYTNDGPVNELEVKKTLDGMSPLKASGVHGLHEKFFQSQWHCVVSDAFTGRYFVSDAFTGRCLGLSRTDNLGKYFSVLLLHARVTKGTYAFLIDKVRKRLSGWEGKMLSLARRVTLAKSVLQSIPNYFMQPTLLPMGIFKEIEKMIRKFIWGSNNIFQKTALVGWDKCFLPQGDGRTVWFWSDHWIRELGPLVNYSVNQTPTFKDATVYAMVSLNGECNWEYFVRDLPREKRRNNMIFNGEAGELVSETAGILAYARIVTMAKNRKDEQNSDWISWQPAPEDWCKLNAGGTKHLTTGRAAAGGLI